MGKVLFALAMVLAVVGVKMLISDLVAVPVGVSLAVIGTVLGGSVAASLLWPSQAEAHSPIIDEDGPQPAARPVAVTVRGEDEP